MVSTQSKVSVKNKYNEILHKTIKEVYETHYMNGFNLIKSVDDKWIYIDKLQKKNKVAFACIKLSNFDTISFSRECNLLTQDGYFDFNNLNGHYIIHLNKLNVYYISHYKWVSKGYAIITKDNEPVQIDNFFVRFNEVKAEK